MVSRAELDTEITKLQDSLAAMRIDESPVVGEKRRRESEPGDSPPRSEPKRRAEAGSAAGQAAQALANEQSRAEAGSAAGQAAQALANEQRQTEARMRGILRLMAEQQDQRALLQAALARRRQDRKK